MKKIYLFVGLCVALFSVNAQNVATFDDVSIQPGSFWNGSDGSGGISSGGFYFPNDYNISWGSWSGFSISNMKDSVTAGWGNQYSAITGGGTNYSENYAVAYWVGELKLEFDNPIPLTGLYVTNSAYAYYSMKDGDSVSKKFGGNSGSDPDYLRLLIYGTNIFGEPSDTVEFFLADFTSDNPEDDYLVKTWEWVNLSELGVVTDVNFLLESTDIGTWGINTPTYFCIDDFNGVSPETNETVAEAGFENLELDAESFYNGSDGAGSFVSGGFTFKNSYNADWASWSGFAGSTVTDNQTAGWGNQYSAIPGTGALGTSTYAVSYVAGISEIEFPKTVVTGFYITNSTYAYLTLKDGDDFSKKFGGTNGTDPDWFKVTIAGIAESGDTTGTIDYYLADFRASNSNDDYIIDTWEWVDLASLGEISKLRFSLSSSDNGAWGMNTPAYFCADQLNHQDLAPVILNPVATVEEDSYPGTVYYVSLDSVFTDPDNNDSEIIVKLENIDNRDLLSGSIVVGGKPGGSEKIMLALNISENTTGLANVTVSATSAGKTVYHSFQVIVSVPVSTPVFTENKFNVYPNPVKTDFFVELPSNTERIILFTLNGEIIHQQNILRENKIRISQLEDKPSGIYFLKATGNNQFETQKIIKL